MTLRFSTSPCRHDDRAVVDGWSKFRTVEKSLAVQPSVVPARVPAQDWPV
jgi:hypothetical protein